MGLAALVGLADRRNAESKTLRRGHWTRRIGDRRRGCGSLRPDGFPLCKTLLGVLPTMLGDGCDVDVAADSVVFEAPVAAGSGG